MRKTLIAGTLMIAGITASATDYAPYININANHIEINGSDLSALKTKLSALRSGTNDVVKILNIGDSHIQAEFITNCLRDSLQKHWGNAGRGLISPLKLAGTNQPVNYTITSPLDKSHWTQTRLLKYPWPAHPGMTGISAIPDQPTTVTWHTTQPGHQIANATFISSKGIKKVSYDTPQDSVITNVDAGEAIYGAILDNGQPGILFSSIGNNGACFTDYSLINNFASDTRLFDADLIILSMGTNEGFSTMSDDAIRRSVHDLIKTIRNYNPDTPILVSLPMECQKNRNHGKRPLSPYYDINKRVGEAVKVIKDQATHEGVMTWNLYEIAGGHGASDKWISDNLFNKDRIHPVKAGYIVMANLLYDALLEVLK
ncbi:MAG: hypothetical protein J6C44_07805 [Muribaculaceae bacterium]|nr:hypothetical protein [Muribaculaceae bacterium]